MEHKDLLDVSRTIDAQLGNVQTQKVKAAVEAIAKQNFGPSLPGVNPADLNLEDTDEDPFNGNVNNRKVAERIAAQRSRKYVNLAKPIHTGDPDKARKDIARSKAINPDPEKEDVKAELLTLTLVPSAGSPAAIKAAKPTVKEAPAVPNGPPAWKPNA